MMRVAPRRLTRYECHSRQQETIGRIVSGLPAKAGSIGYPQRVENGFFQGALCAPLP
jgi:hypothetical protein